MPVMCQTVFRLMVLSASVRGKPSGGLPVYHCSELDWTLNQRICLKESPIMLESKIIINRLV